MISRRLNKFDLLRALDSYTTFNINTIKKLTNKDNEYVSLIFHRLKKGGHITKIEKNNYTIKKDPLLVASHLVWPSYISMWSALSYHQLTEQLPKVISIITTRKRKVRKINVLNTEIYFIKTKPENFFGFSKEYYGGFVIFMAEKEKAIIDAALLRKISFSELKEIIKNNIKELDLKLFIRYLLRIKNKSMIKRFGFLFEKFGFDFYSQFKKFIDKKYIVLDYAIQEKGEKNKKWRIINNVA